MNRHRARAPRLLVSAAVITLTISSLATAVTASAATATTAIPAATAPAGHQPVTIHADPKTDHTAISPSSSTVRTVKDPAVNLREVAKDLHRTTGSPAAPRVAPRDSHPNAPAFTANYAGTTGGNPSAATNGTTTLEATGGTLIGYDSNGNQTCQAIPQTRILPVSDSGGFSSSAQVQYDTTAHRFIMLATIDRVEAAPVVDVAVSASNDPCGTWFPYQLTLTGDTDDENRLPSLGQDPNSVLVSFTESTATTGVVPGVDHTSVAFAVPKAQLYADSALTSFPVFHVDDLSGLMAVSNAGSPMVGSPADYFVAATPSDPHIPGASFGSYDLYALSTSGPATFTHQDHFVTGAFTVPANPDQPLTDTSLDLDFEPWTFGGGLQTSAVYDGSRVWFAHAIGVPGGPATTVRYGFMDTGSNALTFAQAGHDSTSADFDPSIGVGLAGNGVETVWLNWATTDATQSISLSPTVATMLYNGGSLPNLQTADTITVVGGTPSTDWQASTRSSVALDPTSASGSCAVTAQQYFSDSNQQATQLTRVCGPSTVRVPNVAGGSVAQAQAAIHSAFLTPGPTATTTACSPAQDNLVAGTTPAIGQFAPIGSSVTINICSLDATVPTLRGLDDTSAQNRIRSAGFTVGAVTSISDCSVDAGDVSKQDPPAFSTHLLGTPINIQEATGKQSNGKPCVIS